MQLISTFRVFACNRILYFTFWGSHCILTTKCDYSPVFDPRLVRSLHVHLEVCQTSPSPLGAGGTLQKTDGN